jgi:hypothetical protein
MWTWSNRWYIVPGRVALLLARQLSQLGGCSLRFARGSAMYASTCTNGMLSLEGSFVSRGHHFFFMSTVPRIVERLLHTL